MEASGYLIHLYCDLCPPDHCRAHAEFSGETRGDCRKQAKRAGWLYQGDMHLCSKCSRKGMGDHLAERAKGGGQ